MSDYKFKGIVAVGSTQEQAVQRYRMLSMGKGARCFVDEQNGIAFVSNASADIESTFNPINGNLDLSLSTDALEGLEFQATAADTQNAYWLHCTAGCGAHSVFDSQQLVQCCPMCGTAATSEEDSDDEDSELDDLIVGNEDDDEIDIDEESIDEEEEIDDGDDDEEDDSALASDNDDDDTDSDEEDDSDDDSDDSDSDDDSDDEDDSDEDLDDDIEEEVEVEEVGTEENDDMADDNAPLVVVASTRSRAVRRYSELMSKSAAFVATASDEINAEYKVCASDAGCGSHVVSSEELSNCPAEGCGEALSEPVLALDPEAGELADDEENVEDADFLGADEDDVDEEEDDTITEEEEAQAEEDADTVTEINDEAAGEEDVGGDNSLTITASAGDDGEDEQADEDIAGESDEIESNDSDTVELDLLEDMPADADEAELDIAFASSVAGVPTYIALHKGRPVATITAASVKGDIADLFGTPKFTHVVVAASRHKNPKEVLIDLGFKGIAATLNVSSNIKSRVEAGIAEARSALEAEQGEFTERYKVAVATAATGITRGYFAGQQNPVREALCSELQDAGIRNPELMIDRAMKDGMEPFLAAAMDKADQILEKSPEVQEDLARTVVEMGYKPVPGKMAATAADHSAAGHRLDGIGHVVTASSGDTDNKKPAPTSQIVAEASDQQATARIHNVVAGLGRLRR